MTTPRRLFLLGLLLVAVTGLGACGGGGDDGIPEGAPKGTSGR